MGLFKSKKSAMSVDIKIPKHIAIVMDGNGRWAKKRGLPTKAGHSTGAATFKTIARYCNKIGVKYLTVYAFSTENWKRSQEEVSGIMNILREYLIDSANFKGENIRLHFIGDLSRIDEDIRLLIDNAERDSANATGLRVNIALNYGGRDEITHAVKRIAEQCKADDIQVCDITESVIANNLYTAGMPDPDLFIRPGGEYRISNYLIWQSAYSEMYFTDILWPDFTENVIDEAIKSYSSRDRRFGGRNSK